MGWRRTISRGVDLLTLFLGLTVTLRLIKKNDILEENHLANDFGALHMFKNKKNLVVEPKTQKNNFENEFLVEEEVSRHQEDYTLGMEQNERIAPQMLDS